MQTSNIDSIQKQKRCLLCERESQILTRLFVLPGGQLVEISTPLYFCSKECLEDFLYGPDSEYKGDPRRVRAIYQKLEKAS